MVFYPAVRAGIDDGAVEGLVLEALEEHHVVKWTLSELDGLDPACSRAFLDELGESLAKAKQSAPTQPHPRSPDEPPDNIVAATGAAMVDRARDAGRAVLRKTLAKR